VNHMTLLAACFLVLLVLGMALPMVWRRLQRQSRLEARLRNVREANPASVTVTHRRSSDHIAALVSALGFGIARSGLLSQKTVTELEQTLASAGLRGSGSLGLFVGTKLLLLLLIPLLALLALDHLGCAPLMRNVGAAGGALTGLLAPDWWISWRHRRHLRDVTQGLPDALDLMVICAEAGLSFEPTLSRVATEIRVAHPAVAEEFGKTASELRMVADHKVALDNMGARTGLDGIKRMASVLAQTMRYGTPMGEALRVLSAEMRHDLLIRYETRASRLPVLLTIPMILFILPCIFLIVGGPAVIQVMKSY
jgi:tight adherence protein C